MIPPVQSARSDNRGCTRGGLSRVLLKIVGWLKYNSEQRDRNDPDVQRWGYDQCHVLTLALHRMTRWPILTLHDRHRCISYVRLHEEGDVLHSGVLAPDGRFLDVRGLHDKKGMGYLIDLYDDSGYADWGCQFEPSEEDLLEIIRDADAANFADLVQEANALIASRLAPCLAEYGVRLADAPGSSPNR